MKKISVVLALALAGTTALPVPKPGFLRGARDYLCDKFHLGPACSRVYPTPPAPCGKANSRTRRHTHRRSTARYPRRGRKDSENSTLYAYTPTQDY
jgi:hypothetical protein